MLPPRVRWAIRAFASVVPPRDVDVLIGDLEEEYALRAQSAAPRVIAVWYWSQVARSVPFLMWISVRRGGLLATIATAVIACLAQAIVEGATHAVATSLVGYGVPALTLLPVIVAIPSLALVSYVATRIRSGASIVLIALIVLAIAVQLMAKTETSISTWNQLVALLCAPPAAFAGGALAIRR